MAKDWSLYTEKAEMFFFVFSNIHRSGENEDVGKNKMMDKQMNKQHFSVYSDHLS